MHKELIHKLFDLQDIKYRDFHSKLCPGAHNMIGVRIPLLRKLANDLNKTNFYDFLHTVKNQYYEETMIEGFVIATAKMSLSERFEFLQKFVPKIDNWAVCDCVAASFKIKTADLPKYWNFIMQYQNSNQEYELRFMLIMMLDHFLYPEYLTQIFQTLNHIHSDQYYVKMAQAWLIAEMFTKHRDVTLQFLQKNNLSNWVQNKAIQKARESYRVSEVDKTMLSKLKR